MTNMRILVAVLTSVLLGVVVDVVSGDCGNGIAGVSQGDVCCAVGCGTCGGKGCSGRDGGEDSCCTSNIKDADVTCGAASNFEGPCVMDADAMVVDTEGCFADEKSDRVMEARMTDVGMTNELCEAYCEDGGYYYYGTQYGVECWCASAGSDVARHGVGTCDYDCAGDGNQVCGGYNAISTYIVGSGGPAPTPTTPSPPSPSPESASPTPVMTIPTTCELSTPSFRWSDDSGVNGRLYAEGEGCFTMTDLYNFGAETISGGGPVHVLDSSNRVDSDATEFTGKWLLTSELHVTGGGTFYCRGTDIDGDCDELRIQSTGSDDYHEVRGHGGNMYFENTVVTSWDTPRRQPQEDYEGGRSFLNCLSEVSGCVNNPDMGECRMDIINSEMGYLGYFDSESYGLTWKVRGFCTDLSNPEVFDDVNVYGDIKDSDIHHMYYGMYSYGHQGGVWTNNKMHDNHQYGFDPHDDSDYLTISGNEVYDNENHGIIASKRCNNVKIFDNEVRNGGEIAVGIFLHRSSNNCEVYNNVVMNMKNAGLSLMESFDNDIHDNYVEESRYGIRLSVGSGRNKVHDNTFHNILRASFYAYPGADDPEVGTGRCSDNEYYDNIITDTPMGVSLKSADGNSITGNSFSGTIDLEFEDAKETVWSSNTLPSGVCIRNRDDSTFAVSSGLPTESC